MPFTLAHPAAILPFTFLKKKWYSFTGLIIGSIIPDFEGFLWPGQDKTFSHTWSGMFWFDLPLGLFVAFVFHYIVRKPLIENLPAVLYRRFYIFGNFHWNSYFTKNAVKIIVSMLIGIVTHLIWDRVTHTDTYGYAEKAGIILPAEEKTELRIILQYASTLAGVLFMVWWIWKLPFNSQEKGSKAWKSYWFIVATATILAWLFVPRGPIIAIDYDVANTGMIGVILGLIIASGLYLSRRKFSGS